MVTMICLYRIPTLDMYLVSSFQYLCYHYHPRAYKINICQHDILPNITLGQGTHFVTRKYNNGHIILESLRCISSTKEQVT
jgi:hypothetical protein